jgi:hypothetical protein
MATKGKYVNASENPMVPHPIDLDHITMEDIDYKVAEPKCEFKLFKLHY